MPKKERFLFAISLAMFLIPEIVWGPVSNVLFGFYNEHPYRNNYLMLSDNRVLLIDVILFNLLER